MKLFGHFLIASTLCLLSLGSTTQAADHIKDNLGLFSDKAIQQVNQQIDQVYKNHGWTIAVETRDAAKIPYLPTAKSEQGDFLKSWTTKEYKDNQLEGVYVVIFKNPSKFRMHIDTDQQKKMGVTQDDIESWSSDIGKNLKADKFDLALLTTVGDISAKLSQTNSPKKATALAHEPKNAAQPVEHGGGHAAHGAPADEGSSMLMWLLVAGGVFIIFLIIRSVLRGMNQGNAGYGSPNQYGPGGSSMGQPGYGPGYGAPPSRGGGFMSGMLGGLFGGMAGGWMYDQFSGRRESHSDSGQGHFTSHDSSRDDSSSLGDNSAAESDSTTYGGDWGNDSSSSDSGGDSGGGDRGGDSGGGDSGGGGDW